MTDPRNAAFTEYSEHIAQFIVQLRQRGLIPTLTQSDVAPVSVMLENISPLRIGYFRCSHVSEFEAEVARSVYNKKIERERKNAGAAQLHQAFPKGKEEKVAV